MDETSRYAMRGLFLPAGSMEQQDDQPGEESERAGGDGEKHEPSEDSERVKKLALIFAMDHAGVNRSLIDVTSVRVRDHGASDDRADRCQREGADQQQSDPVDPPGEFAGALHAKLDGATSYIDM